jgi:predicted glycogen debranching enzyme
MSAPSFATPLSATPLPAPLSGPVRVGWRRGHPDAGLIGKEWLITNGLGGYASGTLAGIPTRRYHGPLVASLSAPHGRTLMLNHLVETLHLADGTTLPLSAIDPVPSAEAPGPVLPPALVLFQLVNGRPSWRFDSGDLTLEKSLLMPHGQNTVLIRYRLSAARAPVRLALEPLLDMRPHDSAVGGDVASYRIAEVADGFEIAPPDPSLPPLRLRVEGGTATIAAGDGDVELRYRLEQARGYDWRGTLRSAGTLVVTLEPGAEIRLIASTEAWEQVKALPATEVHTLDEERRLRLITQAQPELRSGLGAELAAELLLAADQFIIKPHARPRDEAVLNAQGDTACTVIAGYPWFTDWGRDTMISLEGLTLLTGRLAEARDILHTFAHHVRDGLIPNLFPEGQSEGLYHTADATLWFFHAVDRYEAASGDLETRRFLLPKMAEIIEKHIAGTRFGIGVDPADGLLRQGAPGYQLTWMDAKVGDWVVTPRRGKAVEINALFYNALCLMQRWLTEAEKDGWAAERGIALRAADVAVRAAALQASFNRSGTPTADIFTTSSTAKATTAPARATMRACGPIKCWRSRCRTRCSSTSAGARCSTWWRKSWRRRLACARWRQATLTTSRATTAICARATRLTTRGRCGVGWSVRSSRPGSRFTPPTPRAPPACWAAWKSSSASRASARSARSATPSRRSRRAGAWRRRGAWPRHCARSI